MKENKEKNITRNDMAETKNGGERAIP